MPGGEWGPTPGQAARGRLEVARAKLRLLGPVPADDEMPEAPETARRRHDLTVRIAELEAEVTEQLRLPAESEL